MNKVPAHHKAAEFVEQYIIAAGIKDERNTPLFRSLSRRGNVITDRAIDRKDVFGVLGIFHPKRTSSSGTIVFKWSQRLITF
ncbi:hypothetical protein [Nitrosomonas sp.]|uniref:hypothetical protein n=1 Tax=Nitrosomonas sp. TaxID=42353 RepID=UPI001E002D28|nr:hypothetical protein [Nitrosomonas sp.]MCB1948686.1 hypothetical protein [Nitrosomonas sp.]